MSRAPFAIPDLWSRSWAPEVFAATAVAGLAAALAGAAVAGPRPLAAAVGALQLALTALWVRNAGAPGGTLTGLIGVGAGITADVRLLQAPGAGLAAAAPVAAVAVLPALGMQLVRRDRTHTTAAAATAISAVLLAVCPAALLALRAGYGSARVVVVMTAGAVAVLVAQGTAQATATPGAPPVAARWIAGVLAGATAGTAAAAGYLASSGHAVAPGWLAGLSGAAVGGYLATRTDRSDRLGPFVTGLLALALVAPVGDAVARPIFGG